MHHLWIFAGEVLDSHGSSADALKAWCARSKCHYMPVVLEGKPVLHTAGAISSILYMIDTCSLTEPSKLLGLDATTLRDADLHVVMSEKRWRKFPKFASEAAHVNRFDNINCTLRSFGVDGEATRDVYHCTDNLLRRTFKSMHVFGATDDLGNACYLHVDPQSYANYLCKSHAAALTDACFVKEIWKSSRNPSTRNGILVERQRPDLLDLMDRCATTGENTLVVGTSVVSWYNYPCSGAGATFAG